MGVVETNQTLQMESFVLWFPHSHPLPPQKQSSLRDDTVKDLFFFLVRAIKPLKIPRGADNLQSVDTKPPNSPSRRQTETKLSVLPFASVSKRVLFEIIHMKMCFVVQVYFHAIRSFSYAEDSYLNRGRR